MLFLDRRRRRRLRLAGPAPLLRLLRGDADPDLRAGRRLGWAEPDRRDDHVRDLHDGRLAADARLDRRVRALAGHVRPDRLGNERQRLGLPRLRWSRSRSRRRCFRSTAGCAPRTRRRRPRSRRCSPVSSRRLLCSASSGSCCGISRDRSTTGARRFSCSPRPGSSTARCSRSGSPTSAGRRVLLAGPDGADRARHLRGQRPRARRCRAPLRQPRPRLGGDVPARRDGDPPHRHRPVRRARRDGEGPAGARDRRDGRRHADARRAGLRQLRRRVRDPRRRVRARAGATQRSAPRRSSWRRCTRSA